MANAKICINTDIETKASAQKLFEKIGLDMTTAVNIFLKRAILEQGIPFEVSLRTPNEVTIAAMDEFDDMMKHPDKYKRYSSFKEVIDEVL